MSAYRTLDDLEVAGKRVLVRVDFNVPQDKWIEGIFNGTHGSYWDKDGNLYVQDWNIAGRIMKLVRVQ